MVWAIRYFHVHQEAIAPVAASSLMLRSARLLLVAEAEAEAVRRLPLWTPALLRPVAL